MGECSFLEKDLPGFVGGLTVPHRFLAVGNIGSISWDLGHRGRSGLGSKSENQGHAPDLSFHYFLSVNLNQMFSP